MGPPHVGSYVLVREVARGAMGVVYEAQAPDGARVALKVLTNGTSADALARFDRERRLLGELSGAHGFVPLLDAGEHQGRPWLVMPFMAGGSLRDRLRRGPLRVEDAVALGHQLGAAIGRAHARGIVHRDLKPENVLFERDGDATPTIADLGVARHFRDGLDGARSANLSRSGAMLGTACYMAPEQVIDARRVGPPADVFALAQIVYECLAGVTPFARESLQQTMAALVEGRPPPLRERAPHAPAWLEAALARALSVDPARRFADGQAFARALALGARAPATRRPGRAVVLAVVAALALATTAGVALVVSRPAEEQPVVVVAPAPPPPPPVVEEAPGPAPAAAEPEPEPGPPAPVAPSTEEPASADGWIKRAVALTRARDLDGAIEAYRRAIALNPRKSTLIVLVFALIDARRVDEALVEAERAVAAGADPASLHARGAALIAAGQLRGCADVERALERSPGWPSALTTLSIGRVRARDWVGARDAAEGALARSASGRALRSRGLARIALGDAAGGRDDLQRFRAELDPTQAGLDAELQAGLARVGAPVDPAPDAQAEATRLVEEANLTLAQGDRAATLRLIERARALAPEHAGALATQGALLGEQGLDLLERAIALGPAEGWMFVERANLRSRRRDHAGAADDYARAIARDGATFEVLRGRASALLRAEDPRALEAAAELTRAAPREATGWVLLSQAHRRLEGARAAEAPALRATELGPTETEAWRELGQVYLQLQRWQDALAPFERLLALAPDDPGGLAGRGMALVSGGRAAEGLHDLERAVADRPDNRQAWLALATGRAAVGDAAGARDAADSVLRLQPDSADALRLRALARAELGDQAGARADLAELRRLAPGVVEGDPELQALELGLDR
jgi:tetratricopeptide (TPR) repeat protein